ncbi:hypothetical protein [Flavobacterium pectinovorum]|nr:hypothetical protein [Flavobacterium pectinovorum]
MPYQKLEPTMGGFACNIFAPNPIFPTALSVVIIGLCLALTPFPIAV